MHESHVTTLSEAPIAAQRVETAQAGPQQGASGALVARVAATARQHSGAVRASFARFVIRGQLGPSVGYPHDRWPEPPF